MNKYNRYFRVTEGPLIAAIIEANTVNRAARKLYADILQDIGAQETYLQRDNKLVAVIFDSKPNPNRYKRVDQGWYPKRNSTEGRDLHRQFELVKTANVQECLATVGLTTSPTIHDPSKGVCYFAALMVIPSDPVVAYVRVPWYDEDPEVVEQYKADKAAGIRSCMSLDAITWDPTGDMLEVKEWEMSKAIDEWNAGVRDK